MGNIPCPRAWDDVLGKMLYSKVEQFDDSLMFRFEKHFETETPIYMWPTGLKDQNGKEIYEGDAIREFDSEHGYCHVVYKDGQYGLQFGDDTKSFDPFILWDETEIIGNIYENPELLEVGVE